MPKEKRVGKVNCHGEEISSREVRSAGKAAAESTLSAKNRGQSSKSEFPSPPCKLHNPRLCPDSMATRPLSSPRQGKEMLRPQKCNHLKEDINNFFWGQRWRGVHAGVRMFTELLLSTFALLLQVRESLKSRLSIFKK